MEEQNNYFMRLREETKNFKMTKYFNQIQYHRFLFQQVQNEMNLYRDPKF